ncbi:MAG: exodeoxyribonuclease VII large subunit [Ruminococcaceae bacterium]|nr:exodeoxyribonuclease VII large subunit [Oscillospiraceae bacterium]
MITPSALTVTQVNTYIKSLIDEDINLRSVIISGEISNFKNHYRTGHFYLTLKDENSSIKAVMFSTANRRLRFMPEDGMQVIAVGRISVFERDGQYQLYIEDMMPDGFGGLNLAFEKLKQKLSEEGLFDSSHKKVIPECPMRVGVITSPTGAAIEDILNVLGRRFPLAEVVFKGVEVQGVNAAPSIVDAIKTFDELQAADVLIVGRGGGSIEDLWAFNEESVVRAIYNCSIPVISAVGHETDYTLSDFVADLRAPTPSAAAELAVPDMREHLVYVNSVRMFLSDYMLNRINAERNKVQSLVNSKSFVKPADMIRSHRQYLDNLMLSCESSVQLSVKKHRLEFSSLVGKLDAMSPLKVLSRGYAMVTKDDKVLTSSSHVMQGDELNLRFADGNVKCEVKR